MYRVTMTLKDGAGAVKLVHSFDTQVYGPMARELVRTWSTGAMARLDDEDCYVETTCEKVKP